ncbi:MAG: RNA polymerase sigma factor [Polyangiaceae bacterium]|nr:RNA polymerase sigma factor [Polyangiaceae bacterium]
MAAPDDPAPPTSALLADASLLEALRKYARSRLATHDADDVVQATLTEALAATAPPRAPEELRRWVFGIARHKVADVFRRAARELPADDALLDAPVSSDGVRHEARSLLRWAERELPRGEGAKGTLEWMLREGDGEKLEEIAAEERIPAPRLRQRVSRLRKHLRSRWALAVGAGLAALALWLAARAPSPETPIARERPPAERAEELRREALARCAGSEWSACLDGLDRARQLDPAGDGAAAVTSARAAAASALAPPPPPPPAPSSSVAPPSSSDAPPSSSDARRNVAPAPRVIRKRYDEKSVPTEDPSETETPPQRPAPRVEPKRPPRNLDSK